MKSTYPEDVIQIENIDPFSSGHETGERLARVSFRLSDDESIETDNQRIAYRRSSRLDSFVEDGKVKMLSGREFHFSHLLPPNWKSVVTHWLQEDVPSFDIGGFVVGDKQELAILWAKTSGMLAGVPFFDAVFESLGCTVEWLLRDGAILDTTEGKVAVANVRGPCRQILIGERTSLNIISRASGVATVAYESVQIAQKHKWQGQVAGTRKTTPGFRLVEKYALIVAGAATHREDLSQMVMLKDNHIWSAGSITNAVKLAKRATGFSVKIEVECQSYEEAVEAAETGADIVMLDNFPPEKCKEVAALLKCQFPFLIIEASGGITTSTMSDFFSPDIDVISRGSFTHGYSCLDFSLKIQPSSTIDSFL